MLFEQGISPPFIVSFFLYFNPSNGDLATAIVQRTSELLPNFDTEIVQRTSEHDRKNLVTALAPLCRKEEDTPLHYAAQLGHPEICEILIEDFNIDVNLTTP